ncbi:hypothetical protein [Streptomyces sp. NPDC058955]|uniref:hypothetical protein n=1 Tax=unclassified Streptomyces TaxID=2593676 RepID=UPI00364CA28D
MAEPDEVELVTAVLQDEDMPMAQSVVVRHIDRRAAELLPSPRFTVWAHTLSGVIAEYGFLNRRLQEWSLLRAIAVGDAWAPEELTTASDWCQRSLLSIRLARTPKALALLAEHGRTRRTRNAAARPLPCPEQPS